MAAASLFLLVLALLVPSLALAAYAVSGGAPSGDPYEDAVQGAGTVEGDVWGGEQGTTPAPGDDLAPVDPHVLTAQAGESGWLVRLAALFARIRTSLWSPDQE